MDLFDDPDLLGELASLLELAKAGKLHDAGAARAYALVEQLRVLADKSERDLIRWLRWDDGDRDRPPLRTWAQIAQVVGADKLGSRQAAHKRWQRLIDPDRGTSMGRRLGRNPAK